MDKIIFLGTAGDTETMARQRRGTGGLVLQLEGSQFHLDPGPGALLAARLFGVSVRDTIAVIATNGSVIRSAEVDALVSAMTLDGLDKHGVLMGSVSVIERCRPESKRSVEGVVTLAPQSKVGINQVAFLSVKSLHEDGTAVGLKAITRSFILGYVGDTGWYETIAKDYEDCEILVVNVALPEGVEDGHRMSVDGVRKLLEAVKPKKVFLTGFGAKLLDQDTVDIARQLQRKTKADVTAATDGLSVELKS